MKVRAAIGGMIMLSATAFATEKAETLKFAVLRNGDQIGTHTIELRRNGPETLAKQSTFIEVKIAFITAYRFEQSASERWVNNRLVAMDSVTNDNGTQHKLVVASGCESRPGSCQEAR